MKSSPFPSASRTALYGAAMATAFGSRLTGFRQARGLTQAQLAKTVNVSTRVLSYYENHAECASGELAVNLARALGVTLEELLGAGPVNQAAMPVGPNSEDMRLWWKFQKIRKLPQKDQRAVLRLVNSLVGIQDDDDAA